MADSGGNKAAGSGSVIPQLVEVLAQSHPDLIDGVMSVEKDAREQGRSLALLQMRDQRVELDQCLRQLRGALEGAESQAAKRLSEVQQSHVHYGTLVAEQRESFKQEQEQRLALMERHRKSVEVSERQMSIVSSNYEESVATMRLERDALRKELRELRDAHNRTCRSHAKDMNAMTRRFDTLLSSADARLQQSNRETEAAKKEGDSLSIKLADSLEARGELVMRVNAMERQIAEAMGAMRRDLDVSRKREAERTEQLRQAIAELERLRTIAGLPKMSHVRTA
jgi:chromosome segregation ATPase